MLCYIMAACNCSSLSPAHLEANSDPDWNNFSKCCWTKQNSNLAGQNVSINFCNSLRLIFLVYHVIDSFVDAKNNPLKLYDNSINMQLLINYPYMLGQGFLICYCVSGENMAASSLALLHVSAHLGQMRQKEYIQLMYYSLLPMYSIIA